MTMIMKAAANMIITAVVTATDLKEKEASSDAFFIFDIILAEGRVGKVPLFVIKMTNCKWDYENTGYMAHYFQLLEKVCCFLCTIT